MRHYYITTCSTITNQHESIWLRDYNDEAINPFNDLIFIEISCETFNFLVNFFQCERILNISPSDAKFYRLLS